MKQRSYLVHLDISVYFDLYLNKTILIAEIWIFFYSFEDNYQLLSFIYLQKNKKMTMICK